MSARKQKAAAFNPLLITGGTGASVSKSPADPRRLRHRLWRAATTRKKSSKPAARLVPRPGPPVGDCRPKLRCFRVCTRNPPRMAGLDAVITPRRISARPCNFWQLNPNLCARPSASIPAALSLHRENLRSNCSTDQKLPPPRQNRPLWGGARLRLAQFLPYAPSKAAAVPPVRNMSWNSTPPKSPSLTYRPRCQPRLPAGCRSLPTGGEVDQSSLLQPSLSFHWLLSSDPTASPGRFLPSTILSNAFAGPHSARSSQTEAHRPMKLSRASGSRPDWPRQRNVKP